MGEQSILVNISRIGLESIRELSIVEITIHLFVKGPTLICLALAEITLKVSEITCSRMVFSHGFMAIPKECPSEKLK